MVMTILQATGQKVPGFRFFFVIVYKNKRFLKGGASGLQFGFPFDKLFQKQVLAVEYGIGEIVYPVAEDKDAGGGTQHQIQFDVPMAVDEEVYIRMVLQILFGIQYKMLVVFAHVVGLFPVYSFQAAVLCPPHDPNSTLQRGGGWRTTFGGYGCETWYAAV